MEAHPKRKIAATVLAYGAGLGLLVALIEWGLHPPPSSAVPNVTVGRRDKIYYFHAATKEDAESLGRTLKVSGFFSDRGTSVLLSKGTDGTVVSFAVADGAWNRPATIASFEEFGRRIAKSVGGYPIKVRLIDSTRNVHKELTVGKVTIGEKDEVYYLGSATEGEAEGLGKSLKDAGYLVDTGSSVLLSKNGGTVISFVLGDGAWELPGALEGFERLTRRAAASVGGLPIQLRLLSPGMESKRAVDLR